MKFLAHTCVPVLALLLFGAAPSQAQDNKQGNKLANNMVSLTNPDAGTPQGGPPSSPAAGFFQGHPQADGTAHR